MTYNPCLLRTFNCHINVDSYGSIKSVKYLFKYIYKRHDRASVVMRKTDKADEKGNIDEIKQYRDARWVTPPEALWRIYGFDLSKNIHQYSSCNFIYPTYAWWHFINGTSSNGSLIGHV
jgi:hypothetical protein